MPGGVGALDSGDPLPPPAPCRWGPSDAACTGAQDGLRTGVPAQETASERAFWRGQWAGLLAFKDSLCTGLLAPKTAS